jgi:hypothetical protein
MKQQSRPGGSDLHQLPKESSTPARPGKPALITSVLSSSEQTSARNHGYRLPPDVLLVSVQDGTARLLDLGGNFYALTATAARMLEAALQHRTESSQEMLAAEFGVDVRQIRADMDSFLASLQQLHLLVAPGSRWRKRGAARSALARSTIPILHFVNHTPGLSQGTRAWALLTIAYASNRMFGWTNTVRIWNRYGFESAHGKNCQPIDGAAEALSRIDSTVSRAISRHPLNLDCKERALCCWALSRYAGLAGRIVLGIDLFPINIHCWCESHSHIVGDRYEGNCDRYTPVRVYE